MDDEGCNTGYISRGKTEWPELLGVKGSVAKQMLEKENPHAKVVYIWRNGIRIMDYCLDRIFLYIDGEEGGSYGYGDGKVCRVPKVG